MEEQSRLRWLVDRRERVQRLMHDLYVVLSDKKLRAQLDASPADCSIFGLYVGVAFSLWRAVFLIEATRDKWPTIIAGAEKFLGLLVRDNTMTFERERNCKDWTVGFFLNNARYRLYRILDKMPGIEKTTAFCELEKQRKAGIDNDTVQLHWDTIYCAQYEALFQFLNTRSMFHDQMFMQSGDAQPSLAADVPPIGGPAA